MFRFLLITAVLLCASFAQAQDTSYQDATAKADALAETVIKTCADLAADDLATGATPQMQEGLEKQTACLKDQILLLSKTLFKNQPKKVKDIEDALDDVEESTGELYGTFYNKHDACKDDACGTMWLTAPQDKIVITLEAMVKDLYALLAEYNSDYHFF